MLLSCRAVEPIKSLTPLDIENSNLKTRNNRTAYQKLNKSTDFQRGYLTGFTAIELILVIAVLALLSAAGFNYYFNYLSRLELDEDIKIIKSVLRDAQSSAISGEGFEKWGVRFHNATDTQPYFDLFRGSAYDNATKTQEFSLAASVVYATPASGNLIDVVFEKRTGTVATSSNITVRIKGRNITITRSVTVTPQGRITTE